MDEGTMGQLQQERFTRAWTSAQPAIAGYIAALVPDPLQAEDLLQDVAVILLRKFPDYDPQRPFIAWAMGVAKMALLASRRDQARNRVRCSVQTITDLAAAWQELLPELDERQAALRQCVATLTGRHRTLLELRYQRELAPLAIAEELGMAAGTVRVALVRLRQALQRCIEKRLAGVRP